MIESQPPFARHKEKYSVIPLSTARAGLVKQLMSRGKKSNIILRTQRAQYLFEKSFYPDNPSIQKITTLETHISGAPLRVIVDGLPDCPQGTAMEKQTYFSSKHDYIRKAILQEPRGHADHFGAILTLPEEEESEDPDGTDLDVVFLNTKSYSAMSARGILAITKIYLEMGCGRAGRDASGNTIKWARIGTPAGQILAYGSLVNGMIVKPYFHNVPSFVYLRDVKVDVPDLCTIICDICYGGVFYAIIDVSTLPSKVQPTLSPSSYRDLISLQRKIKSAIDSSPDIEINHPAERAVSTLFGIIFVGAPLDKSSTNHSRNISIYEDGIIDRSPCGTGLSARVALLHAKGELKVGEKIEVEGIIGSTMTVEVTATTKFEGFEAVVPAVGGKAHVMGKAEWWVDPRDKIGEGFVLR